MNRTMSEELFRQAAESEGGLPVSAGARVAHLRMAVEAGRMVYVDLSSVPEAERPGLVAEIKGPVDRAAAGASAKEEDTSRTSVDVDG